MSGWFLEGYIEPDAVMHRVPLQELPVRVGRQQGLLLAGISDNMSRSHAELSLRGDQLVVRDLGSRNGTFVNRNRIDSEVAVAPGDIVHFADVELRVGNEAQEMAADDRTRVTGVLDLEQLPERFPRGAREIGPLIQRRALATACQPIVALASGTPIGRECLGRGAWPELPVAPGRLLEIAASVGREVELSELMRECAIESVARAGLTGTTFVNIHPAELASTQRLLAHLRALRADWPDLELVLELHEAAVTDPATIGKLERELRELDIELAYDDFGSGQARLQELIATPPRYLKFDAALVRDLDRGPEQRRRMVSLLVEFARESGIVTLAEGIARESEADACRALGFELGQGYWFGSPELLG
ncbi:MAG: EAL domain-containing protein [Halofilum sp. (in: g-proteobacteria)]|nr:EAL domain-containing protein [Halofilum sp. (in: g-proteobacteria)]